MYETRNSGVNAVKKKRNHLKHAMHVLDGIAMNFDIFGDYTQKTKHTQDSNAYAELYNAWDTVGEELSAAMHVHE